MKYFLSLTISLFMTVNSFSQEEKFISAKVENNVEFKANSDSVWDYLSNLGNLQNLVPSVIKSSVLNKIELGGIVTLILQNNKDTIVEKITVLNRKSKVISYTMIRTPMPIKNYFAIFRVKTVAKNNVQIIFTASFDVQNKNREARITAFNKLQLELLENIKNFTYEK